MKTTDKKAVKAYNEAEVIHEVKTPEDLSKHLSGICFGIANAMIDEHGYYTCILDGKKTFFIAV